MTSTMAKDQMRVEELSEKPQPTKGNRCGITISTSSTMSVNHYTLETHKICKPGSAEPAAALREKNLCSNDRGFFN